MINKNYFTIDSIKGICSDCLNQDMRLNKLFCYERDHYVDWNGCCHKHSSWQDIKHDPKKHKYQIDYEKFK